MANQKRVQTSYDSGGANTAKSLGTSVPKGDWGNDAPEKTNDSDPILRRVMNDFTDARDYVKSNYQSTWDDAWKCYNNIRTKRGYEGTADDFIPETFTIVESVKANIAGGKPKFNFLPLREEQKQDTKVLNQLMDFYWDQNRMTQKAQNWVQDSLVYGNGILMVSWEGDMPRISNIPLADFFVDPTATHMNNPEEDGYPTYCGYRYLSTVSKLKKKKIINPETGEMEPLYTDLDKIPALDIEDDKLDKQNKEMFIGSTFGDKAKTKQIECIVYYTKEHKYIVANRKCVIYKGKNPYFREASTKTVTTIVEGQEIKAKVEIPEIKPFFPFAILRNYVDSSLFYSRGDVEVILPLQEAMNDTSSQKRDNITYVLNNMWQIDPAFKHLIDQIESVPGAIFPIPQGALTAIEKQMVTGEADQEINRLAESMRRATAADEVIQGASQQQGRVTATEVQAQQNNANQRFSTKLTTLEDEGYAQLGRILFKDVQIFVDQEMAVRIIGPDGTSWRDFDPAEYSGEYEPKVQLESTTKAIKAEEGQKYVQVHQLAANSPHVNQQELMRVYFEKMLDLPEDQIKRLLEVQPQTNPLAAIMGASAQGGQVPPQNPTGQSGPLPIPTAI